MADPPPSSKAAATAPQRSAYFDNVKYVLIVLVVVGHFADPFAKLFGAYGQLFSFIYLFHMPLFVFVTGIFARSVLAADGGFRIGRVGQFLLLYLMLYAGVYGLELWAGKPVVFTPWATANSTWYLAACVLWYLLIPLLHRVRPVILLPGLVAVALLAGYVTWVGDLFMLSRVVCFAPFFFAGLAADRGRIARLAASAASGWRLAAAGVLAVAAFTPFVVTQVARLRPILTGRNAYLSLGRWADWGPGLRLGWFAAAAVLSLAVLLLVPHGRSWATTVGARSLQIYLWHLFALRGLALVAFIPLVAAWKSPLAPLVPLVTALVVVHLVALKPPFGLVIERIGGLWREAVVPRAAAVWISGATAAVLVAVPLAVGRWPSPVAPLPDLTAAPASSNTPGMPETLDTAAPREASAAPTATPVEAATVQRKVPVEFYQFDERWAKQRYGDAPNDTLRRWACGPADMAMIVATLAKPSMTPAEATRWATEHDWYTPSLERGKTRDGFFNAFGKEFHVVVNQIHDGDLREVSAAEAAPVHARARAAVQAGDWVIALMGKGPWATEGHYVLWYDAPGEEVLIRDSNSLKPAKHRNQWSLFTATVQRYWVVDANGDGKT